MLWVTSRMVLRLSRHSRCSSSFMVSRVIASSAPNGSSISRNDGRSEEHTSELQSLRHLVCRLLLEKKKQISNTIDAPNIKTSHMRRTETRKGTHTSPPQNHSEIASQQTSTQPIAQHVAFYAHNANQ